MTENDIEVARRSLRPDNAEDGESNSEEEGQGKWRMVNALLVPVVDVDVGRDDYWDKHLNPMVLVGPILADTDRVRENGGLGTIPAAAAAAPDRNEENDVPDRQQCECSISTCYSLLL